MSAEEELDWRIRNLEHRLRECREGWRDAVARADKAKSDLERMRSGWIKDDHEIQQLLGRALGYPRYADNQRTFPGATDADGMFVGYHVAATLAAKAADKITELQAEVASLLRKNEGE